MYSNTWIFPILAWYWISISQRHVTLIVTSSTVNSYFFHSDCVYDFLICNVPIVNICVHVCICFVFMYIFYVSVCITLTLIISVLSLHLYRYSLNYPYFTMSRYFSLSFSLLSPINFKKGMASHVNDFLKLTISPQRPGIKDVFRRCSCYEMINGPHLRRNAFLSPKSPLKSAQKRL